jgi:hypothetical protein
MTVSINVDRATLCVNEKDTVRFARLGELTFAGKFTRRVWFAQLGELKP